MKNIKILAITIAVILFFSFTVSAKWSNTWSFEYAEKTPTKEIISYDPQAYENYFIFNFSGKVDVSSENSSVSMKNPNPSNAQSDISINQATWNITLEDEEGDTFNWSIEVSNGDSNSSNTDTNGSKLVDLTTPLSFSTTYTVWVNATDLGSQTPVNNSYTFTTEDNAVFTLYESLSFGGKFYFPSQAPEVDSVIPSNGSTEVDMYPLLSITISEPQGDNFNITWTTNASSWIQYNSSCDNGTYTQRATWANQSNTQYWWNISLNDTNGNWLNITYTFTTDTYSWGNWSNWWSFNYTCCTPGSFSGNAWNNTAINLTWVNCDTADSNFLVRNETGWADYPVTITNGTQLYNGTNQSYNDTGLAIGTTYYYTIWGYNLSENEYSVINRTTSVTTAGSLGMHNPYPANESTGNSRPPTNISIGIDGSNIDIYIYYNNHTLRPDEIKELYNWSSQPEGRYQVSTLWENEFIWGGTRYNWTVNITDGTNWLNKSFWFETEGSRYDVDNDDSVFVGDLNAVWAARSGDYDNFFDTDDDGSIFVGDLNTVWANR